MKRAKSAEISGYRAARESVGLYQDDSRAFLWVNGTRVQKTLAGLVSNDLASLRPPAAQYAFVLTPKGRPIACPNLLLLGDRLLIDCEQVSHGPLQEHLGRFLPPRLAQLSDAEDVQRFTLLGPGATELLSGLLAGADPASMPAQGVRPTRFPDGVEAVLVRLEAIYGPGFNLYVEEGPVNLLFQLSAAVVEAGGAVVCEEAWEVLRIERGLPVYGPDISLDNLPQETGQEGRAISLTKGCYTGQEVVARIHYRGHVNRLLRGLRSDEPLRQGLELAAGGRIVGRVTSAAASPTFGHIALGYVRREIEPGAEVAGSPELQSPIRVVELPFSP